MEPSKTTDEIIAFLRSNPDLSGREAARQLGIAESTLRGVKKSMADAPKFTKQTLKYGDLFLDPLCQPRAEMDEVAIEEYKAAMQRGDKFPAVDVFYDGEDYRVADGWHRVEAGLRANIAEYECRVFQGDQRAAILYSLGVNATHGLKRTNADKVRSVEVILNDEEWRAKFESDAAIARQCGVSDHLVAETRRRVDEKAGKQTKKEGGDPLKRAKREAVERMIRNPETAALGESLIARQCGVSVPFVNKMFREIKGKEFTKERKKQSKATASTGNMNGSKSSHREREAGDDDEPLESADSYLTPDSTGEVTSDEPELSEEDKFVQSVPLMSKLAGKPLETLEREARRWFRAKAWFESGKAQGLAQEPKTGEVLGSFTKAVIGVIRFPGPHMWGPCLTCDKKGTTGCKTCHGCGFVAR